MSAVTTMNRSEEDIYQEHVLDHFEDPYNRGACDDATHAHEGKNPLCGDVVHIELEIDNENKLKQAWFDGKGCIISQASASMLMEELEGKSIDEVKGFSADDMLKLFGPRLSPNRQKCCLLSWRVIQSAVHSPLDEDEDGGGETFSGPNLGEES